MKSAYPLVYYVVAFEKTGSQYLVYDYKLENISLNFLQNLFNISPDDPDPINRDMAYEYDINLEQSKILQPFVNFTFDLEKYDYVVEGRGEYT